MPSSAEAVSDGLGSGANRRRLPVVTSHTADTGVPTPVRTPARRWRRDVQGLRAVAVLAVVLYHAKVPGITGGFVGVDVFFVISGFLITGILLGPVFAGQPRGRGWWDFVGSRVRRLVPASTVVLIVTAAATWVLASPLTVSSYLASIRDAALQIVNISFARDSADYLAGDVTDNPVMNFWTLSLEWQFYVVWALVMVAVVWSLRAANRHRVTAIVAVTVVAFVASLAYGVWATNVYPGDAFFLLPSRLWEFLAGALVFFASTRWAPSRGLSQVMAWAGLAMIVVAVVTFSETTAFPGYAALLPVVGTVLVIAAGSYRGDTPSERVLGNAVFQRFGAVSYSWYLWHWPALVLVALWVDVPDRLWWPVGVLVVAASYLLAEATFWLVEEPFRRRFRALRQPGVAIGAAVAATAIVAGSATAAAHATQVPEVTADQLLSDIAAGTADPVEAALFAQSDRPSATSDGCQRSKASTKTDPCEYGDLTSDRTIVLWGDSHAVQWLPAVDKLAQRDGLRVLLYAKGACQPFETPPPTFSPLDPSCYGWQQATVRAIEAEQPEAVIVAGRWLNSRRDGRSGPIDPAADRATAEAIGSTVRTLTDSGAKVLVVVDSPQAPRDIPACVTDRGFEDCSFPLEPAFAGDLERSAIAGNPNAAVVDFIGDICPDGVCRAESGGFVTYVDDNHVTATFVSSLPLTPWREALRAVGVE